MADDKLSVIRNNLAETGLSDLNIVTSSGSIKSNVVSGNVALVVDFSGSMCAYVDGEPAYRIVNRHLDEFPDIRKIYFATDVMEDKPEEPGGGTNLHLALNKAKELGYSNVIVISDGEPNSESLALESAQGLIVSIIYIGDSMRGRMFMERLAKQTGGQYKDVNLSQILLSEVVTALIPEKASKSINL